MIPALEEVYFSSGPIRMALSAALIFFCGGLLVIATLLVSRTAKSHYRSREQRLRRLYQNILNKVIVNETFSRTGSPDPAFEFYLAELRLITGNSSFARHLLLKQILEIKKSLTGNSAAALEKTYAELELEKESRRKLKAFAWEKKGLAIRELAAMNRRESTPDISQYLYSRNHILRKESIMAMVRLEEKPLAFLDQYRGELSPWMRLNIHHYLQNIDPRRHPDFTQYFRHPNLSVCLFSIDMVRQFKQTACLDEVAALIYHANPAVVGLAVATISELEGYQHRQLIARLALHAWRFEKLALEAVCCLGRIGDADLDLSLLVRFLSHPIYTVRYEAVAALKKFGAAGADCLTRFNRENDNAIEGLLRHFAEPLLVKP